MLYRRLKNILGVSMMTLAIVLSQVPMSDTQAAKSENAASVESQSNEVNKTCTVTFNMNGGTYNGEYNSYEFKNTTPVIVINGGETISTFPNEKFAEYTGYKTEKDTWYTDKECTQVFDKNEEITDSITLYKKWYRITSDGEKPAAKGFCMNPEGTVLYKYDGNETNVVIPNTVNIIADEAFCDMENIRGITLPEEIDEIGEKTFVFEKDDNNIVYLYDSKTLQSRMTARDLEDKYEQFVYSEYLDAESVQKIAGVNYGLELSENAIEIGDDSSDNKLTDKEETQSENSDKNDEDNNQQEKSEESSNEESSESKTIEEEKTEESSKEETSDSKESEEETSKEETLENKESEEETSKEESSENKESEEETSKEETSENKESEEETSKEESSEENTSTQSEESEEQSTEEEKTYSVVFHMNGGGFTGTYQDKKYDNAPSLKIELSDGVDIDESIYPKMSSDNRFVYSGYKTDNKWYLDKNCLEEYFSEGISVWSNVSRDDVTLYKKWYHTTSWDGTTEAEKGFVLNPVGTVLYKYTGNDTNITIPACVIVIGNDAFADLQNVKSIKLPAGLEKVEKYSFSGISDLKTDIEIYGESSQSQKIADNLINQYTHFVNKKNTDASDKSNSAKIENSQKTNSTNVTTENSKTKEIEAESNVVSTAKTGDIKLGIQGYREKYVLDGTISSVINKDNLTSIPLDTVALAKSISPISNVPADKDIQSSNTTSVVSQPALAKETTVSAGKLTASAGTVHSTRHIKDATPKTGDPIQYRMIFVCIMFSAGALLLLTGNGYKKKYVAFSRHHRK